ASAAPSSAALTVKDEPLAHLVYDALVQLRGWLARNGSDRGKKGESILPAPVVNQLARSRPRKLDELMAMTLTGFSELRKRTHGQNIIAVIDQAAVHGGGHCGPGGGQHVLHAPGGKAAPQRHGWRERR
ncbi:hypothetical protein Vretifemale_9680, partial [Volvox reticuliferus]